MPLTGPGTPWKAKGAGNGRCWRRSEDQGFAGERVREIGVYGELPEGIVAHHITASERPSVKGRLDARGIKYKWRELTLNAPLNVENGADW